MHVSIIEVSSVVLPNLRDNIYNILINLSSLLLKVLSSKNKNCKVETEVYAIEIQRQKECMGGVMQRFGIFNYVKITSYNMAARRIF